MKKILLMLLTFILVFTTLLPSYTAFSEETENYCENMSFNVQTIIAGDEVIEGKADPESEIDLKINDYKEVLIVGDNGEFEFEIDEKLEVGNKILLTNQQHEIETEVKEVDTALEMIESELDGECEVTAELTEDNEEIKEEESSEENEDNELNTEESTEDLLEEDNENVIDENTEEIPEESTTVEEENETSDESAEEAPEETIEEETDEPVGETSEDDNSQLTDEITEENESLDEKIETEGESEEKKVIGDNSNGKSTEKDYEEIIENLPDDEIEQKLDPEPTDDTSKDMNDKIEENYSEDDEKEIPEEIKEQKIEKDLSKTTYISSKNHRTSGFSVNAETKAIEDFIQPITKNTEENINNYQKFSRALNDSDIEVLILSKDITLHGNGNNSATVKSNSGQKIIIGGGHDLRIPDTMTIEDKVSKMIVRDINLLTDDVKSGFFNTKGRTDIHLENVSFHSQPVGTTRGKFGTGPESTVHFHGQNNINTRDTENAMNFNNLIVHENARLDIDHQGGGPALYFKSDEPSIEVGNNGKLVVKSNNQVISSNSSVNIIVRSPNEVDFKNISGGSLFNEKQSIEFKLQDTHIHGWKKGQKPQDLDPEFMTVTLSGEFSFSSDTTQASPEIKEAIDNWEEKLISAMPRIMFSESGMHLMPIEIEDIYDTDKEIRVKTEPGSTVNIYDGKGNKIDIYPIEDEGVFKFELEEPLNAGDVLKFDAVHNNHISPEVEKVVIGNKLEFVTPPEEMVFETTEIKDEEMIIERESDWNLVVNNTKRNSGWKLQAEVKEPLTNVNDDNDTLEKAMIYKNGDNKTFLEGDSVEIARTNATDSPGKKEINWRKDEGILIKVNPIMAQPDTEYSTTIEWTLTDGP